MAKESLEKIAVDLVERAGRAGASSADVLAREEDNFSTVVRMGKIDSLKEAVSKILGLRVFLGTRSATSYSSDFSPASIERLMRRTIEMAKATSEDPAGGLAERERLGRFEGELALYEEDVRSLSTQERIGWARRAEQAAFDSDPRITNSEGAWFESNLATRAYASSLGFSGSYRASYCGVSVAPIAQNGGGMQRDFWYSVGRGVKGLEEAEAVGRRAAERALGRLGARKVPTCRVPVVFDSETARTLMSHLFAAVRGDAVYREASFLAGKLGRRVAGANVTIFDDGIRPGGFGSRPFDDEGVPSALTPVIEQGVLTNYLLNAYAARKLKLQTTGNAMRGKAGPPSVGPKNLYLAPGKATPEEIIRSVPRGLYVRDLIGFGVNVVTGDYSRGASGLWIENGELTYPVEEVTIAGNLAEMLNQITAIGSDLEFRNILAAPTLLIEGLTVAGT